MPLFTGLIIDFPNPVSKDMVQPYVTSVRPIWCMGTPPVSWPALVQRTCLAHSTIVATDCQLCQPCMGQTARLGTWLSEDWAVQWVTVVSMGRLFIIPSWDRCEQTKHWILVNTVESLQKGQECLTKGAKFGTFACTILYKSCLFYPSWQATSFERPPSWVAFIDGFHCICNEIKHA